MLKTHFQVKGGVGRGVFLFYLPLTLLALLLPPSDVTTVEAIDYYWVTSILGLVFIENTMQRTSAWVFHLTYLLILLGFNRADHMVLPAYPLMALGVGIFLAKLYDSRGQLFNGVGEKYGKTAASALAILVTFYPIAVLSYQDVNSFLLKNSLASVSVEGISELNSYINQNVKEDDLVLTYSYLTPYMKCKTSVLLQAIAYEGKAISYYPGDLKPDRFTFNLTSHCFRHMI